MLSRILKNRTLRPIGLDIGHSSIKMIQLMINGEYWGVHAADQVIIDPGIDSDEKKREDVIVSAIKQMLAKGNFQGKNTVSCLPSGELKIASLRLAEAESEKTEQALRREVTQRFGLDPDKDSMGYIVAGNVRQGEEIKSELILLAADNEAVKKHINVLERADLRPVSIDTIPCALFRSFERSFRRQEDRENAVIFIDFGSRYTTIVFGRGGEISFIKQIEIGGDNFNRQVASKLGVSISDAEMIRNELREEEKLSKTKEDSTEQGIDESEKKIDLSTRRAVVDAVSVIAEELANEISLCLRYYTVTFRGKRVERAILAGGCANEKILLDILRRQLSVSVDLAQPLRGFDLSNDRNNLNFNSDRRGLLCEWAVAVGLSLKGWDLPKYN